jgi:hypothetical protein
MRSQRGKLGVIDIPAFEFCAAIFDVFPGSGEYVVICSIARNIDFRRKLPRPILKLPHPSPNNPTTIDAIVFTANLRSKKMQADVADDFVVSPAPAVCFLKVVSDASARAGILLLIRSSLLTV